MKKDMRARAFHIMDPKGVLEMLILFLEERGSSADIPPSLEASEVSFKNSSCGAYFFTSW